MRHCDIAAPDAHDSHSPNPDNRPTSVNRIDPSIDLGDLSACERADIDAITTLGTSIGEYLAMNGRAELLGRQLDELRFLAAIRATGSQIIRFSKGANGMIDAERAGSSGPASDFVPTTDDADLIVHAGDIPETHEDE